MNGDDGETWIAHVKTVNEHNKTCQVEFYIEASENVYTKEITGRRSMELVYWDSLFGIVKGYWENNSWHYKP